MDLLYFAYYISLFASPIVLYILLLKPKNTGAYTQPAWYHFLKKWVAAPFVRQYQKAWAEELKNVPDEVQEMPKQVLKTYESDTHIIYAADIKGNYFCLKMTLRYSLHAEISIEYRNNQGKIYRLPNEPQVLITSITSRQWKAAGLNIEIVQPFQRIRITYNGFMRNINRDTTDLDVGEVEHVKFNLLWNCATAPLRYPQDVGAELFTEAVARESWRDGEWINMLGTDYGYDQFGALQGFFHAKSLPEDNFVYMPSWRRRRTGPADVADLKRDVFIFGVLKDGTVFSIGAKSIQMGCTQLPYGCMVTSTGELYSISSNDISLEHFADNGEMPSVFTVHFQANGRTYKCVAHINTHKMTLSYNQEKRGWLTKTVAAECDVNSDQANALITFWYKYRGDGYDLPTSLLKPAKAETPEELFVVQLNSSDSLDHSLTGGKGNSLGMLSYSLKSDKFEVPQGFIVTVTSFNRQLEKNPRLLEAIQHLEDVCYGRVSGDKEQVCKETTDLFAKTPVADEVSNLITNEISYLKTKSAKKAWRWAVRSSGLHEDSDELSAAGQNATILGCTTDEDILRAISTCWGSLFAFQSVEYRRRHGIPVNTKMAVVVQEIVPAETAGVLFTCHPSTGDPSQMVITSNYGLGESVVSASADPDTILLSRNYKNEIGVLQIDIGGKKTIITLDDNSDDAGGTRETETEEHLAKKLSITEDQALRLGEIGILLENKFGNPRDIEWAFCNNKLYLLQSRPITTLHTWTDWELQHEMDNPVFSEESVYTRANIGEVCKGAVTALSQSIMKILDDAMCIAAYDNHPSPYTLTPVLVSSHTLFINMLNFMYRYVSEEIKLENQVLDLAVFGHLVFDEKLHGISRKRNGITKGLKKIQQQTQMFKVIWRNNEITNKAIRFNNSWEIRFKAGETPLRMLERIEKQFDKLQTLLEYHTNTSTSSIMYQMIAMMIMVENNTKFNADHYRDISLLLTTNSSVESAEIPVVLDGIATNIRNTKLAEEFIQIDPNNGMKWLEENCPRVKKTFDEFLYRHGHRSFKEFELIEKTWDMDPSTLISMIQVNCLSDTTTKKVNGLTVDETIAQLISPKKKITKYILKFFVKKCRQAVAAREKTKSETVRGVHKFRLAYIEVGKKMVLHGCLPEEELVFHLTHKELKAIAKAPSPGIVSKALRRKRLYQQWNKLHFAEMNYGVPVPEEQSDFCEVRTRENGGVQLQGTPVYQGNVVARACVITDVRDAKEMKPGDILITHSTDISWSPYFPMLAGVVTELGGLISHGAVVAREYGLPCIVGVQNATKHFKTGDKIRLSGQLGLLELVE